jgi:hypothetical protein
LPGVVFPLGDRVGILPYCPRASVERLAALVRSWLFEGGLAGHVLSSQLASVINVPRSAGRIGRLPVAGPATTTGYIATGTTIAAGCLITRAEHVFARTTVLLKREDRRHQIQPRSLTMSATYRGDVVEIRRRRRPVSPAASS